MVIGLTIASLRDAVTRRINYHIWCMPFRPAPPFSLNVIAHRPQSVRYYTKYFVLLPFEWMEVLPLELLDAILVRKDCVSRKLAGRADRTYL